MVERMSLADRSRRNQWFSGAAEHGVGQAVGQTVSLSALPDDLPLSLREVCERVFGGAISVASLRAEQQRGNLIVSKIGRAYFTTPKDLRQMFESCRVVSKKTNREPDCPIHEVARRAEAALALRLRLGRKRAAESR